MNIDGKIKAIIENAQAIMAENDRLKELEKQEGLRFKEYVKYEDADQVRKGLTTEKNYLKYSCSFSKGTLNSDLQTINEYKDRQKPIQEENDKIYAHNKAVVEKIIARIIDLGIPKEVYKAAAKKIVGSWVTAEWITGLRSIVPKPPGIPVGLRDCESFINQKLEDIKKQEEVERQKQKEQKKLENERKVLLLFGKYIIGAKPNVQHYEMLYALQTLAKTHGALSEEEKEFVLSLEIPYDYEFDDEEE